MATATQDFDTFYRQHYGKLAGSLRLMCSDSGAAEELAQEAFVRAYSRWNKVSTHPNPEGWLFTTGYNLAKRRWKTLGRRRTTVGINENELGTYAEPNSDLADLMAAIQRLPVKQRGAVIARYVLGYSGDEAAQLLGISPGALRVTLHRATTALRLDPSFLSSHTPHSPR